MTEWDQRYLQGKPRPKEEEEQRLRERHEDERATRVGRFAVIGVIVALVVWMVI